MNQATNLKGEKLIVLTAAEYAELVEDAGDAALADDALEQSRGKATMPGDLALASLDGTLHPLAAWRKAAGLTQAELADKAGLRKATVSDIENGKLDPRLSSLKALAAALNVDIDDIVN
ncbi:helix-turn-helix transcriptional regulator [Paracoccus sp. (in: a-proteobacteria)]|uniref:helix-turn-helix transcriptional regulator n=1 Tax=Paracoccus sp. TaxID=267 RepID=UPI003A879A9E